MASIQYSDELIEGTVETVIRKKQEDGDNSLFVQFHGLSDNAYSIYLNPQDRAEAIRGVYKFLFSMLKLDAVAPEAIEKFPIIVRNAAAVYFVRPEDASSDESGDILIRDGKTVVVIKVAPNTVNDPVRFRNILNFELMHVQDMMDPAFQFTPADSTLSKSWLDPVRLRYRLLWNIYCVSRLEKLPLESPRKRVDLETEFERLYGAIPAEVRARLFGKLFGVESFTHPILAELARVSANLLKFFREELPVGSFDVIQGSPCPLCKFPTFNWVEFNGKMICERCREHFQLQKETHSWT